LQDLAANLPFLFINVLITRITHPKSKYDEDKSISIILFIVLLWYYLV